MKIIETHNLTKYYGKSRGIDDVNLSVDEGDFFGFIGPNGAGKSTTIRTLLGLINATSGSASIFEKDYIKERKEILSNIGYMPSEAMFYNKLKAKDVISLSADLRKVKCKDESIKLAKRFNLDLNKKVEELSLGNRKKVSIICSLQHKPKLYILDEPTSGLDPLMQQEFFNVLKERQSEGATVLFSSHVLSEVQKYCNRAAIIRDGKIIACDKIEALSNKTNASKVVLKGVSELPKIDGIKNVEKDDNSVSFFFQGDIKKLISSINEMPITDLKISEPELEEIFLHYYERQGE